MRLFADSNIVAVAVVSLRATGHDVIYVGERPEDPGDIAILQEAFSDGRVLLTKDHDIGALVFRDSRSHAGVLLIDDLGSADEETKLLSNVLATWSTALASGGFVRAGVWGSKRVADAK